MPMLTISTFIKYCFRMEAASQTFHYFADCPGDINHKIVISYPQFVVKALSFFVLLSFFCLFLFFDFIQCIIYKPYKSKVHLDKSSATGFFCNETFTLPRLSVWFRLRFPIPPRHRLFLFCLTGFFSHTYQTWGVDCLLLHSRQRRL